MKLKYHWVFTLLLFSMASSCRLPGIPLKPVSEMVTDDMEVQVESYMRTNIVTADGFTFKAEKDHTFMYIHLNVVNHTGQKLYLNPLEFYLLEDEEKNYPCATQRIFVISQVDDSLLWIQSGDNNKKTIFFYVEEGNKYPEYLYFRDKKFKLEISVKESKR